MVDDRNHVGTKLREAIVDRLSRLVFARLGVEDHTSYDPQDPGYVSYQGEGYALRGGNHWAGTHMMGTDSATSVVDTTQRSWDHTTCTWSAPAACRASARPTPP